MIKPGFEFHCSQLDKLSPYVGIEIPIGFGSWSEDIDDVGDPWGFGSLYYSDSTQSYQTMGQSSFGINVVFGADWYFAQNLYMGAEFGLGWQSTTYKEGEMTITNHGNETSLTTPESKSSALGNNFIGGVRCGWRF